MGDRITKATALAEIRKYRRQFPTCVPEISAMGLMRQIDSWEEHSAIIAALDEVLAEMRVEQDKEFAAFLEAHPAK